MTSSTINWEPINTHPIPKDSFADSLPSVLVDNGERIGEAELRQNYGADFDWDDDAPWQWAWTHRSTCSCCHGFIEPQPTHWASMPTREAP